MIKKCFWALCAVMVWGCSEEPPVKANGKQLYEYYCAECHKSSGNGQFLKGVPANATSIKSEVEIVRLIRQGHPEHDRMPVFKDLPRNDAILISKYLKDQLGR